jgi:hypothetical protein
MATLWGATFSITNQKLGEGGDKYGIEVKRVQQLLTRTGHNPKWNQDGGWGATSGTKLGTTHVAWMKYQESKGWKPKPFVDPNDAEDRLGCLADDAGVTLKIGGTLRSLSAVTALAQLCKDARLPYGWMYDGQVWNGGTKVVWGFQGRPDRVIFTNTGRFDFDPNATEPRSLNCTSFANLALSVWRSGNAHATPYDGCQIVGGPGPYLGERYAMPMIRTKKGMRVFASADELLEAVLPDRIYHVAWASRATGDTSHDMVLCNNTVYQANVPASAGGPVAVYTTSLTQLWKGSGSKGMRLWGPGPA